MVYINVAELVRMHPLLGRTPSAYGVGADVFPVPTALPGAVSARPDGERRTLPLVGGGEADARGMATERVDALRDVLAARIDRALARDARLAAASTSARVSGYADDLRQDESAQSGSRQATAVRDRRRLEMEVIARRSLARSLAGGPAERAEADLAEAVRAVEAFDAAQRGAESARRSQIAQAIAQYREELEESVGRASELSRIAMDSAARAQVAEYRRAIALRAESGQPIRPLPEPLNPPSPVLELGAPRWPAADAGDPGTGPASRPWIEAARRDVAQRVDRIAATSGWRVAPFRGSEARDVTAEVAVILCREWRSEASGGRAAGNGSTTPR